MRQTLRILFITCCSQGQWSYVQLLKFDLCKQFDLSHPGPPFQLHDNVSKESDLNFSAIIRTDIAISQAETVVYWAQYKCVLYASHVSEQRICEAFHFPYNQVFKRKTVTFRVFFMAGLKHTILYVALLNSVYWHALFNFIKQNSEGGFLKTKQ